MSTDMKTPGHTGTFKRAAQSEDNILTGGSLRNIISMIANNNPITGDKLTETIQEADRQAVLLDDIVNGIKDFAGKNNPAVQESAEKLIESTIVARDMLKKFAKDGTVTPVEMLTVLAEPYVDYADTLRPSAENVQFAIETLAIAGEKNPDPRTVKGLAAAVEYEDQTCKKANEPVVKEAQPTVKPSGLGM